MTFVVRRDPRSGRMPYHLADAADAVRIQCVCSIFVVRRDPQSGRMPYHPADAADYRILISTGA